MPKQEDKFEDVSLEDVLDHITELDARVTELEEIVDEHTSVIEDMEVSVVEVDTWSDDASDMVAEHDEELDTVDMRLTAIEETLDRIKKALNIV